MNDEQEKVDERWLVTEEEHKAIASVTEKLRHAEQLTNVIHDYRDNNQQLRSMEVDIQQALFQAGPAYDHRPYMRQTPLADDVRKLVEERNEAIAQFGRVKTLTQLALGSEPGESILKLVAELKDQIEGLNIECQELTAALDFASMTEPEQPKEYARIKADYERTRGQIVALERTCNEQFTQLTKLRSELAELEGAPLLGALRHELDEVWVLGALRHELDEVWGIDNLVDINVEEDSDYVFVLQRLIELARGTTGMPKELRQGARLAIEDAIEALDSNEHADLCDKLAGVIRLLGTPSRPKTESTPCQK
jgi:hypothetical protein